MFKKFLSLALSVLLIQVVVGVQSAQASTDIQRHARHGQKVKAGILKLGTGPEARVAVRLRDKTKLAGYISEVDDDSFVISDISSGTATVVSYPNVVQVKGHNLTTGAKVAIVGLSIAVALLAFFLWLENAD